MTLDERLVIVRGAWAHALERTAGQDYDEEVAWLEAAIRRELELEVALVSAGATT